MVKIISEEKFEKARRKLEKEKKGSPSEDIVFTSKDDELNRRIMEKLSDNFEILLIELFGRRDYQKQRNSGLNHVMAKIAKENKIKIGILLDEIIESNDLEKSKILERLKQNVFLCKKQKVQMVFIFKNPKNKRNSLDLKSLGLILGMPTWMTKYCC